MNCATTLTFLRALYRGQHEGYLTLTAIHPTRQPNTPSRHLPLTDRAGIHQALTDLAAANLKGWGAYFSVALRQQPMTRWQRGGQGDLHSLSALFADLDGDLALSFTRLHTACRSGLPAPSAMVGSGRGLHLYWLIQPTTDFATANHLLSGLAHVLGGDALTSANAMRLPGSFNTKPAVHRPCQLLWLAANRRYTLEDFTPYAVVPIPRETLRLPVRAPPTLNPALLEAVVTALYRDYGGFVQPNGWIGARCPGGHARDTPGQHFGFRPDKGVARCFGRHGQLLLKDLCRLLAIDPAAYGGLYRST